MKHKHAKKVLLLVVLLFAAVRPGAGARADEDAFVKGTADFLVDRANANFLYIFQLNLKTNEAFRKYFDNTHDLRTLLMNRSLIQETLGTDIADFLTQSVKSTLDQVTPRLFVLE